MIIVVAGPTGVGKTKLSIALAKELNGEIINADSTQIYKGLDIATAKIKKEEMEGIIHHLIDIKDIEEDYTLFHYQKDCRKKIDEIKKRGKIPILVGGSGLYIKAALYDYQLYDEPKPINNYELCSKEQLFEKLKKIDPYTTIHPNNKKRIIRALNYYDIHHTLLKDNNAGDHLLYDDVLWIGLTTNREELYKRIDQRTEKMLEEGLLEEAKKIYDLNIRTKAVMTPIGYKELFLYFDGKKTYEEAIDLIKQKSRNYAKRQYTWFHNKMNITFFETDYHCFQNTIDEVLYYIKQKSKMK